MPTLQDRKVSTNQVAKIAAWSTTGALYTVAGVLMLVGHWLPAIFIAEVSCGVSAYAAVLHLRCYAARICEKIDEVALERDVARVVGVPRQPGQPVRG